MKQLRFYRRRPAFSMMTALAVMVIMGSIGALVVNLSSKTVKVTVAQYQHEQAELYAKSYTEIAVMAITGNNRQNHCLEDISANIGDDPENGNGYRIRTHIAYIGSTTEIGNCSSTRQLSTNVTTTDTPLTVIIDSYVDYKDPENPDGPWLTVHRRTVQKI